MEELFSDGISLVPRQPWRNHVVLTLNVHLVKWAKRGQLLRTDSTKLALEDDADIGVASAKQPSVRLEERHIIVRNIDGNCLMRSRISEWKE